MKSLLYQKGSLQDDEIKTSENIPYIKHLFNVTETDNDNI